MRITSSDLRAVEYALGRNAKASVILEVGFNPCTSPSRLEVVCDDYKGDRIVSCVSLGAMSEDVKIHVLRDLVNRANMYLQERAFQDLKIGY